MLATVAGWALHVRALKAELAATAMERDQAWSANTQTIHTIEELKANTNERIMAWAEEAERQRALAEKRAGIIRDLESRKLVPITAAAQICRIGEGTDDPLLNALRSLNPRRPD